MPNPTSASQRHRPGPSPQFDVWSFYFYAVLSVGVDCPSPRFKSLFLYTIVYVQYSVQCVYSYSLQKSKIKEYSCAKLVLWGGPKGRFTPTAGFHHPGWGLGPGKREKGKCAETGG